MGHDTEAIKNMLYKYLEPADTKEMRPIWKCIRPLEEYVRMAREDTLRWAMNRFSGQNREGVLRCRSVDGILREYEEDHLERLPGVRDYDRNVDHAIMKSVTENDDHEWDHQENARCRALLEDFLMLTEDCGPDDYAMPLDFDGPGDKGIEKDILENAILRCDDDAPPYGGDSGEEDEPICDTEELIRIDCDGEYEETGLIASFRGGEKRPYEMKTRDGGCGTGKYRDDCTAEEEDLIQEVLHGLLADGHAVIPENLEHRTGEMIDMVSRMGREVRSGKTNNLWELKR